MNWRPEEDELIRQHYPQSGAEGVSSFLPHRSIAGIVNRAYRLKVRQDGGKWTAREDRVITICYPNMGAEYCIRHMPHRTVNAVHSRAARLGLKRKSKRCHSDVDYLLVYELANHRPWRK